LFEIRLKLDMFSTIIKRVKLVSFFKIECTFFINNSKDCLFLSSMIEGGSLINQKAIEETSSPVKPIIKIIV